MKKTKKGAKRIEVMETIMNSLKSDDIYNVLNYQNMNESQIKQYMHQPLLSKLAEVFEKQGIKHGYETAKRSLLWEGNKQTVVNNVTLFGVQHRPDFVLKMKDYSIAIEIKRGTNGSSIREGIGQSIVYSNCYDYVVYLFIDTSYSKQILNSLGGKKESCIIDELWKNHNIMFDIV